MKKIIVFFSVIFCLSIDLKAQFNFKIDTVFFKNEYVSSVSLGLDTNVWVIKNQNGREIGLVNKLAQASDLTSSFQTFTSSSFTDILGLDSVTSMVGTTDDYILRYKVGAGFMHLDQNSGLLNNKVNSLVYVKNNLPFMFDNGIGVMAGTDKGLYISSDFLNFHKWRPIDTKCIARSSGGGYNLYDMDTSTQHYLGLYLKYYNCIITQQTFYQSWYSIFPSYSLANSEIVNSSLVVNNPGLSFDYYYIYWGSNNGLKKRKWNQSSGVPPLNYLLDRTVFKLYERVYFPYTNLEDYYIFMGTDSGLYCNHINRFRDDSIFLVPNTSQYKIMDIDGNMCDNSLWLATDKGLVRILLNYSPDLSFIRNTIKHSLYPRDTVTICQTDNAIISTTQIGTYQWLKDGYPIPGATASSYGTNVPGVYRLVITNSFCNYHIVDTTAATVLQYDSAVDLNFNYPDTIYKCQGQTQELSVAPHPGYSYEWFKSGTSIENNFHAISISETGFYKVRVFNCNNISRFSDSIYVIFDTLSPVIHYSSQILCDGEPVKLWIDSLPYKIFWFNNGSEIISNRNKSSIYVTSSGNYEAAVAATLNCLSRSPLLNLMFNPIPDLSIQTDKPIPVCIGDSVKLMAISSSSSIYNWSNGSIDNSIFTGTAGEYKITAISAQGCRNSDSITVTIAPGPVVDLGPDTSFCEGNMIPIVLKGGAGLQRYVWDNIPGKDSIFYVLTAGVHTVTVYDNNDCFASDTIFIHNQCIPLVFPNLITPNGDLMNDTFFIQNLIPNCSISIYNRWGNLIYIIDDYKNEWNGSGHPEGIYYFVLKSSYYQQEWKGWIEVVR